MNANSKPIKLNSFSIAWTLPVAAVLACFPGPGVFCMGRFCPHACPETPVPSFHARGY